MKKIIVICLIFISVLIFLGINSDVTANTTNSSPYYFKTSNTISNHIDSLVYTETAKIFGSDYENEDAFGYSFDVDGNYLVSGNPLSQDYGPRYGSIYIFERNQGTGDWSEIKVITPTLGDIWGYFGMSVSISDTTIVVGAPAGGSSKGEAYVYEKDYGGVDNWGLVKKLAPPTLPDSSAFGRAVDVYGDIIVVGSYSNSSRCYICGSVFIFERNLGGENNWGLLRELYDPEGQPEDYYGIHVSLYQDTLLVSSENRDYSSPNDNLGAVFIYYRNNGGIDNWGIIKILQPLKTIVAHDKPMRVKGDKAIIGTTESGVRIYGRNTGGTDNWGELANLGGGGDSFGAGVDIYNNYAIVGDFKDSDNGYQAGAAYIYSSDDEGENWAEQGKILASDGDVSDAFGNAVNITDGELFIAAYQADFNDIQAGAIYMYKYEVLPNSDLAIMSIDNPDPVVVGSNLTYTLSINNLGPDDANNVIVEDTLPAGVLFNYASPGCTELVGIVSCSIGDLTVGEIVSLTIQVIAPNFEGSILNTATITGDVSDPSPDNNVSTTETNVIPPSTDLSISIVDSPDPVMISSALTYTLFVNNMGPNNATSVTVIDTLQPGLQFQYASVGCTKLGDEVTCDVGNLAKGAVYTATIVVTSPNIVGTINNWGVVQYTGNDPEPSNNSDLEYTTVADTVADLQITHITDNPDPVLTGAYLSYSINIYNAGPGFAKGILVYDTLPNGVAFVSGDNCDDAGNNVVICHANHLVSHGSLNFTFMVISPYVEGIITNSAYVTGYVIDPNIENNNYLEQTSVLYELEYNILLPIITR